MEHNLKLVDFFQLFMVWQGADDACGISSLYGYADSLKQVAGWLLLTSLLLDSHTQLFDEIFGYFH